MKRIYILLCAAGLAPAAQAQLSAGSTALTVKSGTAFSTQGLVLSPSADLTLQNHTIIESATPVSVGNGATISSVYTITPALTFSGTAGIRYTAGELNGNQEQTLSLIRSGATAAFSSVSSTTGSTGTYYVSATGLNNVLLNRVTATSTAVPLPVHYAHFVVGTGASCSMQLSWQGDDKAQADHFRIERSTDGRTYRPVATVVQQSGRLFTATDPKPDPGRNYYRLAMSERGEAVQYSTVMSGYNPCTVLAQTSLYPNPAGETVVVDLGTIPAVVATLTLTDLSGKVLLSVQTNRKEHTLDLRGIAAGSYLLMVQQGAATEYLKVVKQ